MFRGVYDELNSQADFRPKMSTRDYMMHRVQQLPDYTRVFKDDLDAVNQAEAWLKKPPYPLFSSSDLIMTKQLIAAAKQRVNAELGPDADVGAINNRDLQTQVSGLIAAGFLSVSHLTTDGFNEPETGSAGVEIHFKGAVKSMISYGTPILDFDGLLALTKWLEETKSKLSGLEVELMVNDEGELTLLVLTDAD